jgi:hypothetical protein
MGLGLLDQGALLETTRAGLETATLGPEPLARIREAVEGGKRVGGLAPAARLMLSLNEKD